jgi:hypothetical protein
MANKKTEINWDKLDALLQFKVSLRFCADYLGCSIDSIRRRIKEKYDMKFAEYHALRMERTATKLQQKAIEMAFNGDRTMMIFSLKNLAKWSDKQEIIQDINQRTETIEEYLERTEKK